jgi:adenylyltransferase/sulfurtransferase
MQMKKLKPKRKVFRTKPVKTGQWNKLNSSQGKVGGFDLKIYQKSKVLMTGTGGIGSHVSLGLVRKGIGSLTVLDGDEVEVKNLTRQLFYLKDIGKNKSIQLARHLSKQGFFKTEIIAFPYRFQEMVEMGFSFNSYDAIICGVDNNPTRVALSRYGIEHEIPVIYAAVSREANQMYCFVQEPGKACFGCMFPHDVNDDSYPCDLAGIVDVLQVVSGFVVYALDTILSGRHREWNFKSISLSGSLPDGSMMVIRREGCHICSEGDVNLKNGSGSNWREQEELLSICNYAREMDGITRRCSFLPDDLAKEHISLTRKAWEWFERARDSNNDEMDK